MMPEYAEKRFWLAGLLNGTDKSPVRKHRTCASPLYPRSKLYAGMGVLKNVYEEVNSL